MDYKGNPVLHELGIANIFCVVPEKCYATMTFFFKY